MRRTHLPIAEPCHEDWDAMDPVARGRFCGSCDKQVFDMASMTEPEARELLATHRGSRICVRYACDSAGNLRFRPVRAAASAAVAALALAACTPHQPPNEHTMGEPMVQVDPEPIAVMGEIAEPVPVEPPPATPTPPVAQPAPPPEPVLVKGEIAVPQPEPTFEMGDVAVIDEPCDLPPAPAAPEPAPPAPGELVKL